MPLQRWQLTYRAVDADQLHVITDQTSLPNVLVSLDIWHTRQFDPIDLHSVTTLTCLTSLSLRGGDEDSESEFGNQLQLLQTLPFLHSLSLFSLDEPVLSLEGCHALRALDVKDCGHDLYDFRCYAHLTQLVITWFETSPQAVLLPIGSNVNLQRLCFYANNCLDNLRCLENLQAATQLSHIQFYYTCPENLRDSGWPAVMPKLAVVKLDGALSGPPLQFLGYSSLRHLDFRHSSRGGLEHDEMLLPSWFSQLGQLESLGWHTALSEFPACLLHLKQLCSLNLKDCGLTYANLPAAICGFLEFPALTCLDLSTSDWGETMARRMSSHTQNMLARLKQSLRPGVLQY